MTSPIAMRYGPPPAELGDRISALYELTQDNVRFNEVERADRPQLRILLAGSGQYHFDNGNIDAAYPVTLMGPTSGPVRVTGTGPMMVTGAGLLPPAWMAMAGDKAEQWTDRSLDASLILGERASTLLRDMADAGDTEARFALLCRFIAQESERNDPVMLAFTQHVDAWLAATPDPQISDLVSVTGRSIRQIERLTKRYYGLPPKTLARRYRAIRAASAMARGEDIDALGLGEGFYDQSHLIREIKRFAGLTPTQMRKGQSTLQAEVSEGLKSLEGQVPPLISDA